MSWCSTVLEVAIQTHLAELGHSVHSNRHIRRVQLLLLCNLWIACCGRLDPPCPSVLAVLQRLGPPGAPSDGSRGAGNNPPGVVGTTCRPGVEAEGSLALRGSESHCVREGRHEFVAAFSHNRFLRRLACDYLHCKNRKQETRTIGAKENNSDKKKTKKLAGGEISIHPHSEALCSLVLAGPPGRPRVPALSGASSPAPESAPTTAALPVVTEPKFFALPLIKNCCSVSVLLPRNRRPICRCTIPAVATRRWSLSFALPLHHVATGLPRLLCTDSSHLA